MSITSLTGEAIDKRGLVRMGDYLLWYPRCHRERSKHWSKTPLLFGAWLQTHGFLIESLTGVYLGEMPMLISEVLHPVHCRY